MAMKGVTVRRAVWRYLKEDSEIKALVGDRIDYQRRPDGMAFPCIIISTVDHTPRYDLDGRAWTESRITITTMAQTEAAAERVATVVERCMERFAGDVYGLSIIACRVVSSLPIYQEETGHTHHHVDVIIEHKGV